MANLSNLERELFEKILGMDSGYVLDFSNTKFQDFIKKSVNINILGPKYNFRSGSKANRLRCFWHKESTENVHKVLVELIEYYEFVYNGPKDTKLLEKVKNILKNKMEPEQTKYMSRITILNKNIDKKLCFMLMPFDEKFDDVNTSIKEELKGLNICFKRADDIYNSGTIIEDIFKNIKNSDFIIADLTGKNPNVFYELGYATALNKDIILITQENHETIPFDLSGLRTIKYENSYSGLKSLKEKLEKYIKNIKKEQRINLN